MTHRTNWKTLAPSDPIPGDVGQIRDAGSDYERIKRAIDTATQALNDVINGKFNDEFKSEAVDEVKTASTIIKDGLSHVSNRYSVAASALKEYADELEKAQTSAGQAEEDAQNAMTAFNQACSEKEAACIRYQCAQDSLITSTSNFNAQNTSLKSLTSYSGDPAFAPPQWKIDQLRRTVNQFKEQCSTARSDSSKAEGDIADAEAQIKAAEDRITEAQKKLLRAVLARDAAADKASAAIRNAINSDGQNDTWWDDWGSKVVDAITGFCDWIGDLVGNLIAGVAEIIGGLVLSYVCIGEFILGAFTGNQELLDQAAMHFRNTFILTFDGLSKMAHSVSSICDIISVVAVFTGIGAVPGAIIKGIGIIASAVGFASDVGLALLTTDKSLNEVLLTGFIKFSIKALTLGFFDGGGGFAEAAVGAVYTVDNASKYVASPDNITPLKKWNESYTKQSSGWMIAPLVVLNPNLAAILATLRGIPSAVDSIGNGFKYIEDAFKHPLTQTEVPSYSSGGR